MTSQEKDILKVRLGLAIQMKVEENKLIAQKNKERGIDNHLVIDSLRKLESSSGIPYASIHLTVSGTKNASFTTIWAIAEGLGMKLDDFFENYYYKIPDSEVNKKLKEKSKPKKAVKKKTAKKK